MGSTRHSIASSEGAVRSAKSLFDNQPARLLIEVSEIQYLDDHASQLGTLVRIADSNGITTGGLL